MKLWSVKGEQFAQGIEFKGQGWTVLLYDVGDRDDPEAWVWQLNLGRCQLASVGGTYTTALGARNALIRAVKRLGLRIHPRRARGRKGKGRG